MRGANEKAVCGMHPKTMKLTVFLLSQILDGRIVEVRMGCGFGCAPFQILFRIGAEDAMAP